MREIKFRARHRETGEWFYGSSEDYAYQEPNKVWLGKFWDMLEQGLLDVETCGQYIGLKDKNGKEIYEGDIIGIKLTSKIASAIIEWNEREACFGCKWDEDTAKVRKEIGMPNLPANLVCGGIGNPWEVIGNISETPQV